MKYIFSLIVGILLVNTASIKAQFRDLEWGASESEIIKSEGKPAMKDDDGLYYTGEIAGFDAYIAFMLINGGLQSGVYIINDSHSNERLYINDFDEINSLITKRYGSPEHTDPRVIIDPSAANNEYIDEGTKLSSGAIVYQSEWYMGETIILHTLKGDNYEVNHTIAYKSKDYDRLSEEEKVSDF